LNGEAADWMLWVQLQHIGEGKSTLETPPWALAELQVVDLGRIDIGEYVELRDSRVRGSTVNVMLDGWFIHPSCLAGRGVLENESHRCGELDCEPRPAPEERSIYTQS
jgi:hypothetical protein